MAAFLELLFVMLYHVPLIHTFPHEHTTVQGAGLTTGRNLGFSVLPEDTLTCGQEELKTNYNTDTLVAGHRYLQSPIRPGDDL